MPIDIVCGRIWNISKKKLLKALNHQTPYSVPDIFFNILNQPYMVDKILMNQKLDELGIIHPKTFYYPFDDIPKTNQKCVIKHRLGSRGNHLIFTTFNKINEYNLYDRYIQSYVPFEKEYRICVNWRRVIGIREKILTEDCDHPKIRNSKTCFYKTEKIPELKQFAWDIAQQFNAIFTGIDIGLWHGRYIVIELNSSPAIGDYWAKLLAKDLLRDYART